MEPKDVPPSASDAPTSPPDVPSNSHISRTQLVRSSNLYATSTHHLLVLQEDDITVQQFPSTHPRVEHSPPKSRPPPTTYASQPFHRAAAVSRALNPWRLTDRIRTVNGILVLCLNIGVDPPDASRLNPRARLEAWTDPTLQNATESMQQISTTLKRQFESLQHKARYRVAPDPTVTELRRLCVSFRRSAKTDRVLFLYNGHGVPRPTPNGEFWLFNHNYTQYIPFNLYDLHEVLGSPTVYIFDTNSAGTVLRHFAKLYDQFEREYHSNSRRPDRNASYPHHRNSIFLAACAEGERLPTTASLPADLFTSCLTTPIKTALRWFWRKASIDGVTYEMLDEIPGTLEARNTPLGELKWIFTAITDTIAWNVLPRDVFNELYRRDLMVASLMRNFLLANRIMHFYRCTPLSYPELPDTHTHPLWQWFELAMENILVQLPRMISDINESKGNQSYRFMHPTSSSSTCSPSLARGTGLGMPSPMQNMPASRDGSHRMRSRYLDRHHHHRQTYADVQPVEPVAAPTYGYQSNPFFQHQLGSFDIWLEKGPANRGPPEQLPMTLHSLLSPADRLRTLQLLSRFVQTGAEAVDLTLSVGMFPYVLRLLQHPSNAIRQELVFIWAKILALDGSVCSDLVEKNRYMYFLQFIANPKNGEIEPRPVYMAVAFYILSIISARYADRLRECKIIDLCLERLNHFSPFVRRWACLCLTEVMLHSRPELISQLRSWTRFVHRLGRLASEDVAPDVRAAATFALSHIMCVTFEDSLAPEEQSSSGSHLRSQLAPTAESQRGFNMIEENVPNRDISTTLSRMSPGAASRDPWIMDHSPPEAARAGQAGASRRSLPARKEFKPQEQEVLVLIGRRIALNLDRECSTLVRREISMALSKAVLHRPDYFLRAAYFVDVDGVDAVNVNYASSSSILSQCENACSLMWISLTELAYDSHPVVAAIARESVDLIYDQLQDITGTRETADKTFTTKTGTSPKSFPGRSSAVLKSDARDILGPTPESGSVNIFGQVGRDEWSGTQRNSRPPLFSSAGVPPTESDMGSPPLLPKSTSAVRSEQSSAVLPPGADSVRTELHARVGKEADILKGNIGSGRIHVRGTGGRSFDLSATSRMASRVTRVPRTSSVSVMPSVSVPTSDMRTSARSADNLGDAAAGGSPKQKPHLQVVKGIETFMRSISQQFHFGGVSPGSTNSANVNSPSRDGDRTGATASKSPPRPPRRSHSYQILNTLDSLSPTLKPAVSSVRRVPRFTEDRKNKEGGRNVELSEVNGSKERGGMYGSDAGNATLSLFEWSCALINRVQCDADTVDGVREEQALPRRITMWEKLCRRRRRAEQLSKKGQFLEDWYGSDEDEEIEFSEVRQLGVYMMGAGGGAVTAMAFLPSDKDVGDYELLATGDSMGSVGVYDVQNGACKGSFGVPSPPGIAEVGVSSIVCLNRFGYSPTGEDMANSRSALILAGAYDGRAAVFKSDVQGRQYRIMSTFQASGKSLWSTGGATCEYQGSGAEGSYAGSFGASSSDGGLESASALEVFSEAVQQSGNGLSLAFDHESSMLVAGGCENEVVRMWDLGAEQCVWQGVCVQKRAWPTALSIWSAKHAGIIVVGSSDGRISVMDTRESGSGRNGVGLYKCGEQRYPIISVGTCTEGKHAASSRDVVVAADIGGELVFWDARWNGGGKGAATGSAEMARIRAHRNCVTAMAVHPNGQYVATGSTGKCVKIFGADRTMEHMMFGQQPSGSALFPASSPIRAVTSISFEPRSNMFAIGCRDSSVVIYGDPMW